MNLPFRVERVELAPLVFVPAFIITIYIVAFIASLSYKPQDNVIADQVKEKPTGIKVNNTVGTNLAEEPADELLGRTLTEDDMLAGMLEYYKKNEDFIGWLKIDDMKIDYPVTKSPEDDMGFYVHHDFDKNPSDVGCLTMDIDSKFGEGFKDNGYVDGEKPTSNIIIYGHNMRNGSMFGDLDLFRKKDYEEKHKIIKFTTLYEEREYEIISVFLSQIYPDGVKDAFEYYYCINFPEEKDFDYFYKNIKKSQLYDTGVTAEFGDEFITLSTCTYHVQNGRLVVVGKRIK